MENTLRVRRAERRWSQRRLARLAGISADRYWRIENDHIEPTEDERARLAAAFETTEFVVFPVLERSPETSDEAVTS